MGVGGGCFSVFVFVFFKLASLTELIVSDKLSGQGGPGLTCPQAPSPEVTGNTIVLAFPVGSEDGTPDHKLVPWPSELSPQPR